MRIQCLTTRSVLKRYVDGELRQGLHRAVLKHLDRCAECRTRMQNLQRIRNQTMGFAPPDVAENEWEILWSGVLKRVEEETQDLSKPVDIRPFPHLGARSRYVLVAAAVAVLVAGAALRVVLAGNAPQQTSIASYIQYHENAVDGHVLLENHFWNAQVLPVSYTAGN